MNYTGKGNLLIAVLALFLALMGELVYAMQTGVYQAPDISKFVLISEDDGDGDGDGIKETHILRYRNVAGDSVFSMTIKHRLWAWSQELHGRGSVADMESNYVIRDSDCNGTFDERYNLQEQFYVPNCLK